MTWVSGTVNSFKEMQTRIRNEVCGYHQNTDPVFSGTPGAGELSFFGAKPGTTVENWLITCTEGGANESSPGANDGAKFSVFGQGGTGALAEAQAGVYYDTPQTSFMINRLTSDFIAGNTFTVAVTGVSPTIADGTNWELMAEDINTSFIDNLMQMQATGLAADKTINVILDSYGDESGQIFSIGARGAVGYDDQAGFGFQPGEWGATQWMLVRDDTMNYYISINKQRFIVLTNVASSGHSLYAGFFLPYGSPSTYPFPMFIGSDCAYGSSYRFDNSSNYVRALVDPAENGARVVLPGGGLESISHFDISDGNRREQTFNFIWPYNGPYSRESWVYIREDENGKYPMFPCVLFEISPGQALGELDGVCAIAGFNLTIEDIVQDSELNDWIVWPIKSGTGTTDYFAVRTN